MYGPAVVMKSERCSGRSLKETPKIGTVRGSTYETPILAQSRVICSLQFQQKCLHQICYRASQFLKIQIHTSYFANAFNGAFFS